MSDENAPKDWAADVKRYVPDADDRVIAKIVSYCGIALRSRDASMVSFSDKAETDRVREKFCKKKLALEDPDDVIDAAIAKVGERMSDTSFRNRVTVYYLLAEHFGKLGMFAGASKGAAKSGAKAGAGEAAPIAPLAAAGAAGAAAEEPAPAPAEPAPAPADPAPAPAAAAAADPTPAPALAGAPAAASAAASASATGAAPSGTRRSGSPAPAGSAGSGGGFMGLAVVTFGGAAAIMMFSAIAGSAIGGAFDTDPPPPIAAPAVPAAPAAPAIPDGAGIVSETVEGRPKVSVYFDVGKTDIAPDFTAAVAPVKAWLDANPADRVQLSGFSDPTGNAAANAELAKNRAQAVSAALADQGVAADRVDLVKPADTTDQTPDLAGARRVEITVTPG